ncbi:hypothetical protein POKO110462_06305 [Pontibacter korlensis]
MTLQFEGFLFVVPSFTTSTSYSFRVWLRTDSMAEAMVCSLLYSGIIKLNKGDDYISFSKLGEHTINVADIIAYGLFSIHI